MTALAPLLQLIKRAHVDVDLQRVPPAAKRMADRVPGGLCVACPGHDDGHCRFCQFCGIPAAPLAEEGQKP